MFGHGPPSQFIPYPPPYYGHYPRPPGFGYSPQPRGRGYGNQGWDGWRGRGRGRYGGGGYRARGGRYSQSKWQNEGASSNDIDAYYSKTMFEDPWKELLPESPQSESGAAPSTTREGGSISSNIEQEIDASTLGETAKKDSVEDHPDDQGENVDCTDRLLSVGDISGTCSKATNDQQSCNDSGVKSSSPICTKDDDHDFVKTASDDSDKTETVECNLNPVEGEAQNQVQ